MRRLASLFLVFTIGSCASEEAPPPSDVLETGAAGCEFDSECAEAVCWKLVDYDPECGGTICSLGCTTDVDCQRAAADAGASRFDRALCGFDGRCDLRNVGLAGFLCIRPGPECTVAADCGYNTVDSEWRCDEGSCMQVDGVENPCMENSECQAEEFCYLDPTMNRDLGVCVPERCRAGGDCMLDDGGIIFIEVAG